MKRIVTLLYTSDNEPMALDEVRRMLSKITDIKIIALSVVESKRACRNAYGKELSEDEFDAIDPDIDEAWFDDYDFVFELVVNTKFESKELLNAIENAGICITDIR